MGLARLELFSPMASLGPSNILVGTLGMGPAHLKLFLLIASLRASIVFGGFPLCSHMGPARSQYSLPMVSLGPSIIPVDAGCLAAALVWAQRIQNYFRRWRHLGPTSSLSAPLML
jgi:hypothetical protein